MRVTIDTEQNTVELHGAASPEDWERLVEAIRAAFGRKAHAPMPAPSEAAEKAGLAIPLHEYWQRPHQVWTEGRLPPLPSVGGAPPIFGVWPCSAAA